MERDPEESSWIEARWLDRPGSAIGLRLQFQNAERVCDIRVGGQPRLIPSKVYISLAIE